MQAMAHRPRSRRSFAVRTCAAGAALLLVVWFCSIWAGFEYRWGSGRGMRSIGVNGGCVFFSTTSWFGAGGNRPGPALGLQRWGPNLLMSPVPTCSDDTCVFPLWLLIVPLGAGAFFAALRSRAEAGRCPRCGYDLAGLSGALPCPECGSRHAPKAKSAPATAEADEQTQ